jgi:hypothetical protein
MLTASRATAYRTVVRAADDRHHARGNDGSGDSGHAVSVRLNLTTVRGSECAWGMVTRKPMLRWNAIDGGQTAPP